jgi:TonB family protein
MPAYPPELARPGIQGVVIVRFVIAENGTVCSAKRESGPAEFWPVIVEAMRQWRFERARDARGCSGARSRWEVD